MYNFSVKQWQPPPSTPPFSCFSPYQQKGMDNFYEILVSWLFQVDLSKIGTGTRLRPWPLKTTLKQHLGLAFDQKLAPWHPPLVHRLEMHPVEVWWDDKRRDFRPGRSHKQWAVDPGCFPGTWTPSQWSCWDPASPVVIHGADLEGMGWERGCWKSRELGIPQC